MLSPNELAALMTAIAAILGGLGAFAVRNGKKEIPPPPVRLMNHEDSDRHFQEVNGLVRAFHQEVRVYHQELRADHRDTRDRLVRLEAMLDQLE